MTEPAKHTPLPWHFSQKFRYVSDTNHRVIAEISPVHGFEANAAFIVRAVNSHDAIVKALEPFAECVREDGTVTENMCPADYRAAAAALTAAKDTP